MHIRAWGLQQCGEDNHAEVVTERVHETEEDKIKETHTYCRDCGHYTIHQHSLITGKDMTILDLEPSVYRIHTGEIS